MAYELLTNLIFEPKGKHDPSLTYTIKDTVMSDDGSKVYFARKDVPAGIPLTDTEYWMLQMDLSSSKNAMDTAAATAKTQTDAVTKSAQDRVDSMVDTAADAIANLNDYTEQYGLRVRGETHKASGNPIKIYPDAGSLFNPVTTIKVTQEGSGDPYPAGGGKNLLPSLSESVTTNGITFTPRADGKVEVNGTLTDTGKGAVAYLMQGVELPAGTYTLSGSDDPAVPITIAIERNSGTVDYYNADSGIAHTFDLAAGNRVSAYMQVYNFREFGGNAIIAPQIERGSVATDFEKHENIRPFIGYDKLDLNHTGKNLCNISPFLSAWATENADMLSLLNTLAPGTYTVSVVFEMQNPERASATDKYGLFFYPHEYRVLAEWGSVAVGTTRRVTHTFNVTADNAGKFTAAYFYGCGDDGIGYTGYATAKDVQLEIGSTASDFQPYQGKLHTVQIGQTVYGGKFDWLTGKLTAEWAVKTLTGTEEYGAPSGWGNKSAYYCAGFFDGAVSVDGYETVAEIVCSHAPVSTPANIGAAYEVAVAQGSGNWLYVCLGEYDTPEKFKAYLAAQKAAGTPVQIVYKLATPIEIQLAPTAVLATETEGVNYIYGDGDIEVEYVIPLKQSIAKRVNMLLDTFAEPFEKTGDIVTCEPVAGIEFDSVVSTIEPKQSGSGDPYPAGGGKNLLVDVTVFDTVWLKGVISLTAGITYTLSVQETADALYFSNEGGTVDYATAYNAKHLTYTPETSGIHVLFARYANGADLAYNMMLEKGSAATEYAPPSNIRPITGYDAVKLNHAGKNLLPNNLTTQTVDGITITVNADGSVLLNGTANNAMWLNINDGLILKSGSYIISGNPNSGSSYHLYAYDGTKFYYEQENGGKFTLNADTTLKVFLQIQKGVVMNNVVYRPMIRLASDSDATFQPYTNTLHTVQIGQTVYGIRYEWLTGKGVIEWAMVTLTDNHGFYLGDVGEAKRLTVVGVISGADNESNGENVNLYCTHYKSDPSPINANNVNNAICGYQQDGNVYIRDDRFNTYEEAAAYFAAQNAAGTPVQIVYKLATPIEIRLTPTEIIALSGVNNLYGSCKTTVAGRQSKTNALESRIAAIEAAMTNA